MRISDWSSDVCSSDLTLGSSRAGAMASINEPHEERSFCRICTAACGVIVSIGSDGRIATIRGDRDDPQSLGFVCSKGTSAPEEHNGGKRLLHPLKRMPDGNFERISLEQALEEIAAKLREIIDRDGPEAVSAFKGSGGFLTAASLMLTRDWLSALGSHNYYSTLTIDQSAKVVTAERIGTWQAGKGKTG